MSNNAEQGTKLDFDDVPEGDIRNSLRRRFETPTRQDAEIRRCVFRATVGEGGDVVIDIDVERSSGLLRRRFTLAELADGTITAEGILNPNP